MDYKEGKPVYRFNLGNTFLGASDNLELLLSVVRTLYIYVQYMTTTYI